MAPPTQENVLLEAMAQTAKANPRTDQAGSEEARGHSFGHLAEKLLTTIQNISDEQWIIERDFLENRTHFQREFGYKRLHRSHFYPHGSRSITRPRPGSHRYGNGSTRESSLLSAGHAPTTDPSVRYCGRGQSRSLSRLGYALT